MADQLQQLFEYVRLQAIHALQGAGNDPIMAEALFAAYIEDSFDSQSLIVALTVFAIQAARDELAREPQPVE